MKRKLGQLFMFGFEGINPEDAYHLVDRYNCGGVILFAHNVVSRDQLVHLNGSLQEKVKSEGLPGLLISVDQEGGRVDRLGGSICPTFCANWEHGTLFEETKDASPVRIQAVDTARVLLEVGINMNLAPVMDVVTVDGNDVIGDRSYGANPGTVTGLGIVYIQALQNAGIIATAKHFPGHGPTDVDSHYGLPVIKLGEAELRELHLGPFNAAIDAGVDAIMPAHIVYGAWDKMPATLSKELLKSILRDELGFDGVVISDDMNMHAISRHYPFPGCLVDAANAGVDILLVCYAEGVQDMAWQSVVEATDAGKLDEERVDESLARIMGIKNKYGLAQGEAL